MPEYGERSPDGFYWWDGNAWQSVQGGTGSESEGTESQTEGQPGTAGAGSQAGGQGGQTDGQTGGGTEGVLAKVSDPSELQGHFENAMAAAEGQVTELEA